MKVTVANATAKTNIFTIHQSCITINQCKYSAAKIFRQRNINANLTSSGRELQKIDTFIPKCNAF